MISEKDLKNFRININNIEMEILGIDIGGTGIKGAIVDTITGELISERFRVPTPKPATPENVSNTMIEFIKEFKWH